MSFLVQHLNVQMTFNFTKTLLILCKKLCKCMINELYVYILYTILLQVKSMKL